MRSADVQGWHTDRERRGHDPLGAYPGFAPRFRIIRARPSLARRFDFGLYFGVPEAGALVRTRDDYW